MEENEILSKLEERLKQIKEAFASQLREMRAGRLSVSLIQDIKVECFGSVVPLKQLGAVSVLSQRELLVQVWDRSYIESIVKAIEQRKTGLGVRIEGTEIRLSAPPLTEESKKALITTLNQQKEKTFQTFRRLRDKTWKEIQRLFQDKEISENEKYKQKEKMEEVIKKFRKEIEEMAEAKEKEIKI